MRGTGLARAVLVVLATMLAAGGARAQVEIVFFASTGADEIEAHEYRAIWATYGERIVQALERRTCLAFQERLIAAEVVEAVSHSGGPAHPMRLRASYISNEKKSTLVHELGHRHLWQLAERVEAVDGHRTLYLMLDRVWADVWGEAFAETRVRGESRWRARYDYAAAWRWARSLTPDERQQLWNRLLAKNGFDTRCDALVDGTGWIPG